MFRLATQAIMICTLLALTAGSASAQVLFSVQSEEGRTSWLLGTLHSADPSVLDLPPVLEQILVDAGQMMIELVPDAASLELLDSAMRLPEGQVLTDHLPDALARAAQSLLVERGVAAERARRMQPWAAAMILSQPPAGEAEFMDLVLARRALRSDVDLSPLETMQEQIDFFRALEPRIHRRMLELAVAAPERLDEQYRLVLQLYLARDLDALRDYALQQLQPLGEAAAERYIELGITQRNQRMLERALPLLQRGNTLLAVGALHLPGPDGLVEALRQAGFKVEPIY